jgi:hypothetical protein
MQDLHWKVQQYVVNRNHDAPVGGETIFRSMSGWLKTGSASAIILLLMSAKKLLTAHKNCSQNLITMSKFIVSKNLLNKFARGESILLTENHELPFILLAI